MLKKISLFLGLEPNMKKTAEILQIQILMFVESKLIAN